METTIETVTLKRNSSLWNATRDDLISDPLEEEAEATACLSLTVFRFVLYALPIVYVVGLVGNALSFKLLSTRALKCRSARVYLKTLAIADSCVILIALFEWTMEYSGCVLKFHEYRREVLSHSVSCMLFRYTRKVATIMSSWIIVIYSAERAILIRCPLRRVSLGSEMKAYMVMSCLFVIACLSQVWIFPTVRVIDPDDPKRPCRGDQTFIFWWNMVNIFSFLVPGIFIIISNVIIILTMRRENRIRGEFMTERQSSSLNRRVTVTLVCVSFGFVITTLPEALWADVVRRHFSEGTFKKKQDSLMSIQLFLYLLQNLNYSSNFFIYSFRFNQFSKLMDLRFQRIYSTVIAGLSTTFSKTSARSRTTNDGSRRNQDNLDPNDFNLNEVRQDNN